MQALFDLIAIELFHNTLAALLETLDVFWRPPILQVAARVELRPLVVETMGDFVSNDGAYATVVVGVIALGVIERRLQNPGREHDFVKLRIVVRVDRGRRHPPLAAIDGFANLCQVTGVFKLCRAKRIDHVRTTLDFEG